MGIIRADLSEPLDRPGESGFWPTQANHYVDLMEASAARLLDEADAWVANHPEAGMTEEAVLAEVATEVQLRFLAVLLAIW